MSWRHHDWLHRFCSVTSEDDADVGSETVIGRHIFADLQSLNRTLSQLQRARRLLARPEGWTQGSYARDGRGATVDSHCAEATSFCASGAIYASQDDLTGSIQARTVIYRIISDDIEVWNDANGRSQADIVRVFDRAIASVATLGNSFRDR